MSRRLVPLLAALAALAAPPTAGAAALDSVTVEIRVEARAPTTVSMDYFLRPAGAAAVRFGSVRFGDSRAANVRAFVDGTEVSFRTEPARDARVDGLVELPAGAAAAERVHLRLDYEILPRPELAAGRSTLTLPLLVAAWPPVETRPETFRATVHLPPGLSVLAAFPTGFEPIQPIDRTAGGKAYRFVLPVVPALIRIRAAGGELPWLTAQRAVDAGAIALLAGLALAGWRRLRESLG